jgi:BMFP domain-containing protein YqiC
MQSNQGQRMAKTLDQFVQDTFGAQALTICRLQAELEVTLARIAELEAAQAKQAEAKPDKAKRPPKEPSDG